MKSFYFILSITAVLIGTYLIIPILPYLFAFLIQYVEVDDNYYKTLQAAERDGAVERGWIPPILPASSKEIYERHDIDTNEVWIRFQFNTRGFPGFVSNLKRLNLLEIKSLNLWGLRDSRWWQIRRPKWWPQALSQDSIMNAKEDFPFITASYERLIPKGNGHTETIVGYFFLNPNTGNGYYYSECL